MSRRQSLLASLCVLVLMSSAWLGARESATQAPAQPAVQGPAPGAPPAAGRGGRGGGRGAAPVVSPEVGADRRVTFRLRAPNAKQVSVAMGGNTLALTNDGQGLWTATSEVLEPNYYTYSLNIDGTTINDPGNRLVQTGFGNFQSMFIVPGPDPWFPSPSVAKGAVTRHSYRSSVANDTRDFFVYTPAGYEPKRSRPYPILYLLHGLGDDAERWMNGGGAPHILDNLIASGKTVPMVVVTTLGYGVNNGPAGAMAPQSITGYTQSLLTEVMPAVERGYNVSRDRQTRAIAGLSMGGAEALFTALNNVDRFAWVASFSGAFVMWPGVGGGGRGAGAPPAAAPAAAPGAAPAAAAEGGRGGRGGGGPVDPAVFAKTFPGLDSKVNSRLELLWITCGTADSLIGINRQFKDWLRTKDVKFEELEVPDVGHVWPFWRQNLAEFVQRAFK